MNSNWQFLGWGALQIRLSTPVSGAQRWAPVELDWQPGDIRNCSYAAHPDWIGITAEDRTKGQQVLAVWDCQAQHTQVLLRLEYVLHHSLNQAGSMVCYTLPSTGQPTADLYLKTLNEEKSELLAQGAVAQNSTPVWFPDDQRIAYHSPGGQIEVLDRSNRRREILTDGLSPSVSPDGERIAFCRDDQLFIWSQASRNVERLEFKPVLRKPRLTGGLSWSPDQGYLSFGVVAGVTDKSTDFYLLELASGESRKIETDHLRGLLIIARTVSPTAMTKTWAEI